MNEAGTVLHSVNAGMEHPERQAGRNTAPQAGATDYTLPDKLPPPWDAGLDLFRRWRRRVRCDGRED